MRHVFETLVGVLPDPPDAPDRLRPDRTGCQQADRTPPTMENDDPHVPCHRNLKPDR
jgi:hypothetical protein